MTWTSPSSKGFATLAAPYRANVFVLGLILRSVVSGTCLIQTAICTFPLLIFLDRRVSSFRERLSCLLSDPRC